MSDDRFEVKHHITLTSPPSGKRKQYGKDGEEMKYGRMK